MSFLFLFIMPIVLLATMCGPNEDPTFTIAAKYLSLPQNQELKFSIEAKLNN